METAVENKILSNFYLKVMSIYHTDHIGIVAGAGKLPELLIAACKTKNRPYSVVALAGHTDSLTEVPAITVSVGEASTCFAPLRKLGVKSIVMAGKVERPHISELKLNWTNLVFLFSIGFLALTDRSKVGDDYLLRTLIKVLEKNGFLVVGVEDILDELTAEEGSLTDLSPSIPDWELIRLGVKEAQFLGLKDIGQASVVKGNCVIGNENLKGTDALIRSCAHKGDLSSGPILIKLLKPIQDRRVDLPVIGPDTILACVEAGFKGIIIEAKGTLIVQRDLVLKLANDNGLFLEAVRCNRKAD